MRIWQNGNNTKVPLSEVTYAANGTAFTAEGVTYQTSQVDSITFVHIITVTWNRTQATVEKGNVLGVDYSVEGGDVVINSTNTHNELEFVLQGSSTNGSLTYTGTYKCKFYLNNSLEDAPNGQQKAALYCKGHLEIEGGGSLTVIGNSKHGICTKEYLQLKKSTGNVTVNGAVSDGIHAGQYFMMNGGTVTVSGQQGDGIQAEILTLDDDITIYLPPASTCQGKKVFVKGGTINVTVAGDTRKGIKSDAKMTVTGGTFDITATGDGSKGISVKHLQINQDDNTTLIQIKANGSTYEDDVTDEETRCMGIKVDKNMAITAGTLNVSIPEGNKVNRGVKIDGQYYETSDASVKASIKLGKSGKKVTTMPSWD